MRKAFHIPQNYPSPSLASGKWKLYTITCTFSLKRTTENTLNFEAKASSMLFKNNKLKQFVQLPRELQSSTSCFTSLSLPRLQCAKKKRKEKKNTHTHTHSNRHNINLHSTLPPTDQLKKWYPLMYVLCYAFFSLYFFVVVDKTPTTNVSLKRMNSKWDFNYRLTHGLFSLNITFTVD